MQCCHRFRRSWAYQKRVKIMTLKVLNCFLISHMEPYCHSIAIFHHYITDIITTDIPFYTGAELQNALAEFLKQENSKAMSQMLSLRVTYLLRKAVRERKITSKDLDMRLLLEGVLSLCTFHLLSHRV